MFNEKSKPREITASEVLLLDSLLNLLQQTGEILMTTQRISLAWLIERTKLRNPTAWQNDIKSLEEKIRHTVEVEGTYAVSHLLSNLITDEYNAFLRERAAETEDQDIKNKIRIVLEMNENCRNFNLTLYKKRQKTSFGGVAAAFTPEWFKV